MDAVVACATCGTELRLNAKFCDECGSATSTAPRVAEYKQVTVLFADVVHSMDIAKAVGAERLREIMAALVDGAAAVVGRYGGTLDKFTGDGIMAVFGAPLALEDHALRACRAALDIHRAIGDLAEEVRQRDGVQLQLRIGLNSGQVIAGEIGSGGAGYTAIGEQVGLAQRMESVAPAGWSDAQYVHRPPSRGCGECSANRSWSRSRAPINRSPPSSSSACRTGITPPPVVSRFWSVGAGRWPPLRVCCSVPPTDTARW